MSTESESSISKYIYPKVARKITKILIKWGNRNFQNYPWRYTDKLWHGLIAEIFLQRTRAKNVVPVYLQFTRKYTQIDDFASAGVDEIADIIRPLGLNWRAKYLVMLGNELKLRNGEIPDDIIELVEFPGVGIYAATAYLIFHRNIPGTIIDANVVRFICRLVGRPMDGETRRKKWLIEIADELTPKKNNKEYNYAILDFSMSVCTKKPDCSNCPFSEIYCKTYLGGK